MCPQKPYNRRQVSSEVSNSCIIGFFFFSLNNSGLNCHFSLKPYTLTVLQVSNNSYKSCMLSLLMNEEKEENEQVWAAGNELNALVRYFSGNSSSFLKPDPPVCIFSLPASSSSQRWAVWEERPMRCFSSHLLLIRQPHAPLHSPARHHPHSHLPTPLGDTGQSFQYIPHPISPPTNWKPGVSLWFFLSWFIPFFSFSISFVPPLCSASTVSLSRYHLNMTDKL